jgi:hypothetical protein
LLKQSSQNIALNNYALNPVVLSNRQPHELMAAKQKTGKSIRLTVTEGKMLLTADRKCIGLNAVKTRLAMARDRR